MNNSEEQIAEVVARAEELGISHFQTGFTDAVGRILGKRYNVANLKKSMTDGV